MGPSILDKLAAAARERVAQARAARPLEPLMAEACFMNCSTGFPFEQALRGPDISFICECKRASPSKGLIAPDFPYLQIAQDYEAAGAAAVSVLTEPRWFLGRDSYLREIASAVKIPCLRKDFTVDEYMIYEAKILGAAAVLLIVSLLDGLTLRRFIGLCDGLGLSALVEAHDETEIKTALDAGARVIGVNNRNLKDFSVDVSNSGRLRSLVPEGIIFVAESGIKTTEDVAALRQAGVNAVLVGEALMKAPDRRSALAEMAGAARCRRGAPG
ncbi:MAG: indole-3-glycerol phosphate synthase TrpC [Fretibacterium sp.]|nr:indole-3-glycerol phosphate synthase TrpC [Fretibacterium sp.]